MKGFTEEKATSVFMNECEEEAGSHHTCNKQNDQKTLKEVAEQIK
jgi:hypothetical protein